MAINQEKLDGGLRLQGAIPILFLQAGVDYSFREERTSFLLSFVFPVRRGGIFGRGSNMRFDIATGRGPSFSLGVNVLLGQPYIGTTRPKKSYVALPKDSEKTASQHTPEPVLKETLMNVRGSLDRINRFTTPFFDMERKTDEEYIELFKQRINQAKEQMNRKDENFPDGHTFEAEVRFYNQELEKAFALASALDKDSPDMDLGRRIAKIGREILFNEVVLPYNRLLGQRKKYDSLLGLGTQAERKFKSWVYATPEISAEKRGVILYVYRRLIYFMDEIRANSLRQWNESRLVWIPFHSVLKFEDHDTQPEMDSIMEKVTGENFTEGNDVDYMMSGQFQMELARMIHAAEDYHVLWIHDYTGLNAMGNPDEISYRLTTDVYLRALINRIKSYEQTREIPAYMIFLDQHYYEAKKAKRWLELLENPLNHKIKLPKGYETWEKKIREVQEELRVAVENSPSIQANVTRYGKKWLRKTVKVHIYITNPSDLTFRSGHLVNNLPFIPDNLMRDHRKISFYDVTELDPGRGEALYTGMGVGEHYATPTWDDRAVMARGPALVGLKDSARELLFAQGFKDKDIPAPLQPIQKPAGYDRMVEKLIENGWRVRATQTQNYTGYGPKPSSLVKAVLYNLMPPGAYLFVPDSLWNSSFWAGMLVGSAIRGCRVFTISPSYANAPSSAAPTMSRTNEVFTQLVIIQNGMREEIERAGGMLKVGVYDVDIGVGDQVTKGKFIQENIKNIPWFHQVFPFEPAFYNALETLPDYLEAQGYEPKYLSEDEVKRRPKLHLKSQLFVSDEAFSTLLPLEGWGDLLKQYVMAQAEVITSETYVDVRKLRENLLKNTNVLVSRWQDTLASEKSKRYIFYLSVGSHNQDYRSKVMDGEAMYVVSSSSATMALLDFAAIMGLCTWIDNVKQLEELLPKIEGFWYKLGRTIKLAI